MTNDEIHPEIGDIVEWGEEMRDKHAHVITIKEGDPIGQVVFFEHEEVPAHASYATKGRYNGFKTVQGAKA